VDAREVAETDGARRGVVWVDARDEAVREKRLTELLRRIPQG
jgi:hypothetical protein